MKIKKGSLLALTKGEYSDYCLMGHARALIDFDSKETAKRFSEQIGEDDYCYEVHEKYSAWLIREGIVEPVDSVIELYLGSYGKLHTEGK